MLEAGNSNRLVLLRLSRVAVWCSRAYVTARRADRDCRRKLLGSFVQAPQLLAQPENLLVSIIESGAKRDQGALQNAALLRREGKIW